MAWQNSLKGGKGRRVLEGANLVVYTAVVVAIIVVANVFLNRYYTKRWDLTPTKKFSLSPQTQKILKGLDRDVTIYDFEQAGGSRSNRDQLDNYGAASKRVTVRYVDADREPALSRQFDVHKYGTVIVASGDRHFQAQSVDEEGVTNALVRLLKGQKAAYFVQGHGERDLDSSERGGYSELKKAFENENYQVKTLVLLQNLKIPPDCALLVIAGPRNDYLQQEVDALEGYLIDGGRLLFMADAGTELPNLSKLLANWNVTLRNDLVIDENPVAQMAGAEPSMPLILKYGQSPIVQPIARTATLFPLTRSFLIGKEYKTGVVDESLCETTEASFGVADFNPKMQSVSFRPDKDYKGPLIVAVSGTLNVQGPTEAGGQKKPEGRFVALGTSSIAVNAYLGFGANRDLLMNSANWLAAEEDLISIRPKPPENQRLELNAQQMNRILYLGVFGIPVLIILMGVSVWWGRR
jgi:gliding motility-associatede transport system auxiliary component